MHCCFTASLPTASLVARASSFQRLKHLPRNTPPARGTERDVLLVRAVKIAAAGLEQAEAIGERVALAHPRLVVIAVNHLDAGQAEIDEVFDDAFELRIVLRPQLDRVREDGHPP